MGRLLREMFGLVELTPISQANREIGQASSVFGRGQQRRDVGHTPATARAQADVDSATSVARPGRGEVDEVTVEVPDEDMPGLQRAILQAIKAGDLPSSATRWARASDTVRKPKKEPETPPTGGKRLEPKAAKGRAEPKDEPAKASGTAKTVRMPAAKAEPAPEPKKEPGQISVGKGRTLPATNRFARRDGDEEEFPDLPAPRSAVQRLEPDEPEYRSPWADMRGGGSSWEALPRWMTDPEMMPGPGSTSRPVPRSAEPERGPEYGGPKPVGRPWTDRDVKGKRPGLLSRIFGGKR